MKPSACLIILCTGSFYSTASDTTTKCKTRSEEEFLKKIKSLEPGLQDEFLEFMKRKDEAIKKKNEAVEEIKKKDEVIKQKDEVIKQKDEVIQKKDKAIEKIKKEKDDNEFHKFVTSSCTIREEIDRDYKNVVNQSHYHGRTKIETPPSEISGQIYNVSEERWLLQSFPKWLAYINEDQSELAHCFRENLEKTNYSTSQMAWSFPKMYKFYNRYSHPQDSPAYITFEEYLLIKEQTIDNRKHPIEGHLKMFSYAEYDFYRWIKYECKTFLGVLEARNSWYVTRQDCQMINIVRKCHGRVQFECRPIEE